MKYLLLFLAFFVSSVWATQLTPKGCEYYAGLTWHYAKGTLPKAEFVARMRKFEEGDPDTENMMYRMMEFVDKNQQSPETHAQFFYRQCVEAQGDVNQIYSFGLPQSPKQPQIPSSSQKRVSLP